MALDCAPARSDPKSGGGSHRTATVGSVQNREIRRTAYIVGIAVAREELVETRSLAYISVRASGTAFVGRTLLFAGQLGELEEALQAASFFRAHRSTLVNLAHVKEIRPDFRSTFSLLMADLSKTVIEVSERQARALRERIPGL